MLSNQSKRWLFLSSSNVLIPAPCMATDFTTSRLPQGLVARLRAWWIAPNLNGWVFLFIGIGLFLRNPNALLNAQFWAEDGAIFLLQHDVLGFAALIEPYMGYLHTVQRIVAAISRPLIDARWLPADPPDHRQPP